jgi:hypothetical protein
MSNISINQASKLFKVSRNTIYARIKKGEITKNSDGNVSVQDVMRLFGNKADKKATEQAVTELLNSTNNIEQLIEQPKSNNEQILQQQIEQLKVQVEQLEKDMDGKLKDKYNREKLDEIARIKTQLKNKKEIDKRGVVMDNKKITKLNDNEPTIMEVDVVYGNEGSMKTTTILLAVKCTIHVYNSEDFCKEIANTLYTERAGFRAIQLFTGEISFWSDFLFAVDKIKPYYVNERSSAASMFARLTQTARTGKRLNINNKTQSTFIPTTTIVLTLDEVENIKRICQENIMSSDIALKFINITGIMNLLVVEEATGVLYRFDHSTKQFDKTSIPMEDQENKKSDNLIKALSMALVHR